MRRKFSLSPSTLSLVVVCAAHLFILLLVVRFYASTSSPTASINKSPRASATSFSENTAADYDKHIENLQKKTPEGFTIIIQKPFVVIGNEPPHIVKQRAESTVKWAVDKLKQDYFAKDPTEILDIWLFKDEVTYNKYAKELFGHNPDTPYGYYSSHHKALVMNISTGGGTLVHEIVHPFMEANFPAHPAWFNEGIGSLYEQSGEVDGRIYGYPNWRLPGLQKVIKAGNLQSFKAMTAKTDEEFYNDDTGVNYAQARYLCYYLQEKKLLVKFYKEFVANQKSDPTGYKTLQRILGERSMIAFQKRWERFVLKLSLGYSVNVT